MLLFTDKELMHSEDAAIYRDPTNEIDAAYLENKRNFESEVIPILLAMLHQWEVDQKAIPIYARSKKLLALRADLLKWIDFGFSRLEQTLAETSDLLPHLARLENFYRAKNPGVDFRTPNPGKFPALILEGKTIKEWLKRSGDGLAQRIIKHWQNQETVYNAVLKAWDSGLDFQYRLVEAHYLYRNRIAEVLFYKANPHVFRYLMFSAVMDGRTSRICRGLNGKVYDINNASIPIPPLHPHCRSRLVPFKLDKR